MTINCAFLIVNSVLLFGVVDSNITNAKRMTYVEERCYAMFCEIREHIQFNLDKKR